MTDTSGRLLIYLLTTASLPLSTYILSIASTGMRVPRVALRRLASTAVLLLCQPPQLTSWARPKTPLPARIVMHGSAGQKEWRAESGRPSAAPGARTLPLASGALPA